MPDLKKSDKKSILTSNVYSKGKGLSPHVQTLPPELSEKTEYWDVPILLKEKMITVARDLRKEQTRSEQILWKALKNRSFNGKKFRRQQPIGPFVVDFLCPETKLIIEIDGDIHITQIKADRQRQKLLESLGFYFLRIKSDEVENDLSSVLSRISLFIN